MQAVADLTNGPHTGNEYSSENIDGELRQRIDDGWRLHCEIAAMEAALRANNPHRPVLPPGMQARPVVPRELAAPFVPRGTWHQLLVTSEYAYKCSGAERMEAVDYSELQQGLQRQLRNQTVDTLRLQQLAQRNSQSTLTTPH